MRAALGGVGLLCLALIRSACLGGGGDGFGGIALSVGVGVVRRGSECGGVNVGVTFGVAGGYFSIDDVGRRGEGVAGVRGDGGLVVAEDGAATLLEVAEC